LGKLEALEGLRVAALALKRNAEIDLRPCVLRLVRNRSRGKPGG
jgi:hypothetical protein